MPEMFSEPRVAAKLKRKWGKKGWEKDEKVKNGGGREGGDPVKVIP